MRKRILQRNGVTLGILVFVGIVLWGGETPKPVTSPSTLRVMTFNIHHGVGLDGRLDLKRIAQVIRKCHPDLVALQEVDRGVARTQRRDLPAELARLTGMRCLFSCNLPFQGGEYGNAVLTRLPILSWTNHHYRMVREGEQRGVLEVTVRYAGQRVVFFATHLDARQDETERLAEAKQLLRWVDRARGDWVLVAGDFNAQPSSRTWHLVATKLQDAWASLQQPGGNTFPSDHPRIRIDYVWFLSHAGWNPISAWIPETQASDHRPLCVVFQKVRKPNRGSKN